MHINQIMRRSSRLFISSLTIHSEYYNSQQHKKLILRQAIYTHVYFAKNIAYFLF